MATRGIWMPIEILHDKSMTMLEKFVLMEIQQLSELDTQSCYASNAHFAKLLNISTKSASKVVSSLAKKGIIAVELSDRNHKRLLSTKGGGVSTKGGGVSTKGGESKDNNSINNSINIKNNKKSEFGVFISLLKELFKKNSLLTYQAKINTSKSKLIFTKDLDGELIASSYIDYVKRNGNMSVRLDRYLIAWSEGNLSVIEYGAKETQDTTAERLKAWDKKRSLEESEIIDVTEDGKH